MSESWIYYVWPWIGLGGAISIIILLFCTDILRSDTSKSRWKDGSWLAWLASAAYLIHNVEEYGIDLNGTLHAFPASMRDMLGAQPPEIFYMAVNVSMFWFVAPIAAKLSKKHPVLTIGMAGELFINAVFHILPVLGGSGYSAGLLTGIIIFLPVSIWSFIALCGKKGSGKLSLGTMFAIIGVAIFNQAFLVVTIMLSINGIIGTGLLVFFQILNAALALIFWLLLDKRNSKKK